MANELNKQTLILLQNSHVFIREFFEGKKEKQDKPITRKHKKKYYGNDSEDEEDKAKKIDE